MISLGVMYALPVYYHHLENNSRRPFGVNRLAVYFEQPSSVPDDANKCVVC